MRNFKKYHVWIISHELVLKIYNLTEQIPEKEKYQLISQMQRAAYSIPSNFSEGCGRESDKDLNYIPEVQFVELTEGINEIKRKLYNLSKKLKA